MVNESILIVGEPIDNDLLDINEGDDLANKEFEDIDDAAKFLERIANSGDEILSIADEVILSSDKCEESVIVAREIGGITKLTQTGIDYVLKKL